MIGNYGKTWSFEPATLARPKDAEAIARVVRAADKVRVMGSRHSWSKGIVTAGTLLSLDAMNRVLHVDKTALTVTVQAGITLKALIKELEGHGLALANLGSISEQTLAGAMATGTHGTGIGFQCLASQIESLKFVDGEGTERTVHKGDAHFDAVAVGLGCHGVVHEITLRVVPGFQMKAITDTVRFDEFIEKLDDYVRGYDHFKFWWLVPGDRVIVFMNQRTDAPRDDSDLMRWFNDEFVSVGVYRALVGIGKIDRQRFIPPINTVLTALAGKRFERTCKSYVGFLTPVPPIHREAEWAFDYAHARELLREYRSLLASGGYTYNFIQEVRFTKGDGFWMSPACGRDSIWLSMYNMDTDARWRDQLARFDAFAMAHEGRPHWGKEAGADGAYLGSQYPQSARFREVMRAHDPQGKFINAWVESIFA